MDPHHSEGQGRGRLGKGGQRGGGIGDSCNTVNKKMIRKPIKVYVSKYIIIIPKHELSGNMTSFFIVLNK